MRTPIKTIPHPYVSDTPELHFDHDIQLVEVVETNNPRMILIAQKDQRIYWPIDSLDLLIEQLMPVAFPPDAFRGLVP